MLQCNSRVTFYTITSSTRLWVVFSLSTLYFNSVHAHTFLSFNLQQLFVFYRQLYFICSNFFIYSMSPVGPIIIWFSTLQNSDSWLSFRCSVLHLHYWPRLFQKGNNATLYTVDNIVYPVDNAISFPYTYPLDNDLFSG